MFEKGKDPYEGENYAPIDKYLKAGNRLKKPDSCPDSIWEIMFKVSFFKKEFYFSQIF